MTRLAWHQRQIEYLRLDQVVEEVGPKRDVRYPRASRAPHGVPSPAEFSKRQRRSQQRIGCAPPPGTDQQQHAITLAKRGESSGRLMLEHRHQSVQHTTPLCVCASIRTENGRRKRTRRTPNAYSFPASLSSTSHRTVSFAFRVRQGEVSTPCRRYVVKVVRTCDGSIGRSAAGISDAAVAHHAFGTAK
jgi:hypothetical protein